MKYVKIFPKTKEVFPLPIKIWVKEKSMAMETTVFSCKSMNSSIAIIDGETVVFARNIADGKRTIQLYLN